jgi:hypothetical protein
MARPNKTGLDYFPLDVDFFEDEKMLAISGEFAVKGEIISLRLLCEIYRNGYFVEYSELLKNKLARLGGLSGGLVDEVVGKLVKYGFFDGSLFSEKNILTSNGIQKRFVSASKRRENGLCCQYCLIKEVSVCKNYLPDDVNVCKNAQSKVKSSNEDRNKSKPPLPPEGGCEVVSEISKKFKAFQDWILKNAPNVAKMSEPFTEEQYVKLREKYPDDFSFAKNLIIEMHNWKPLNRQNVSAYKTFNNWTNRRKDG